MKRENGYYWVKIYGAWLIAKWHEDKWLVIHQEYKFNDDYWDEIDETKIERLNND